jgi:hypothetical protein
MPGVPGLFPEEGGVLGEPGVPGMYVIVLLPLVIILNCSYYYSNISFIFMSNKY